MKNLMKQYLGNDYTDNHLRNFCLYWMKAAEGSGDEWRRENDLDCLYFDGDLKADTLMSAWTPVKWVADFLNRDNGRKFTKRSKGPEGICHDLKLLAEDRDAYLPPKHELVRLLDRFLALAEERCNFILLPDRRMNPARYHMDVNGRKLWFYDEVPVTLSHIFRADTLGQFFDSPDAAVEWVKREHLEMGFRDGVIDPTHILPLVNGLDPQESRWFTEEDEIREALTCMIRFLETRRDVLLRQELECSGLFELYLRVSRQEYLWVRNHKTRREDLYFVKSLEIWHGEKEYYHDPSDIDMPGRIPEKLVLTLKRMENDRPVSCGIFITVDMLMGDDRTADELMRDYGIRIPTEEELLDLEYDDGIPSVTFPVPVPMTYRQRRLSGVMSDFLRYLKSNRIPFAEDTAPEMPRYTFSFRVPDVPGGVVESCIWFYEDAAEVRTYYSAAGAEICGKSEHRDGLLRLLNYINARVFLSAADGGNGRYTPHMMYTPRIYLTEDGCHDITITTIISLEFWKRASYVTADYITAYCPELLNKLSCAIFGVLEGIFSPEEAIAVIRQDVLNEDAI